LCDTTRSECDTKFSNCMKEACNVINPKSLKDLCDFDAQAMYRLVRAFGTIPFVQSQYKSCIKNEISIVVKGNFLRIILTLFLSNSFFDYLIL
jgi:hypothetical protein